METGERTPPGDLTKGTKIALRAIVDFPATEKHPTREDAHRLSSITAGISISRLVNENLGVYLILTTAFVVARQ
jgi:hypothetical protein